MQENMDATQDVEDEVFDTLNIPGPFDPSQIDVDIATLNLGSVIEMLENDEIDLNPDFQRNSNVWNDVEQSRLIESILLGLPLPSFYFNEEVSTGKWSVIDGLQRLCSISHFVLDKERPLVLQGLQFLVDYNGKTFDQLDRPDVRRIKAQKITTNTLRKSTPPSVKYVIFRRVNTAGKPLNSQELRHSMNPGPVLQMIAEMSQLESFLKVTEKKLSPRRMVDRDFVTRYLGFLYYFDRLNNDLDYFLNEAMYGLNRVSDLERAAAVELFDQSMIVCGALLEGIGFRRLDGEKRMPINKSLWDSISVNVAKLSVEQRSMLVDRRELFLTKYKALFADSSFVESITKGTEKNSRVNVRFSKVKLVIEETLKND